MTALDVERADDDGIKAPGTWRRKGDNGPPIVTDPNGEANVSGARKGQVKLRTYSRPSNFGKQVENTYNLEKWNERMVALGMAVADPYEVADDIVDLRMAEIDDPAWKRRADAVVVGAKRRAGAMQAADRGTYGHHLTEDNDLGRSIITRIEAGEDLGLSPGLQTGVVEVWRRLIAEHFEVLAVEFPCVFDAWRVAGTGDRIVRLKHDLKFELPDGRVVVIPKGTVIVLDIKTGGLKTSAAGVPLYWHSYAVQVAAYALSEPYDVDTERRGEWPWPISTEHAVIAHIDIAGALDTDVVTAQLIYVDLIAGRDAGDLVCSAKAWQNRKDVFSPAGAYLTAHTIETGPGRGEAQLCCARDHVPGDDRDVARESAPAPSPNPLRDECVTRARVVVDAGHGLALSCVWPQGIPGFKSDHVHTDAELRLIYAAVCEVEDEHGVGPGFVDADRTRETRAHHQIVQGVGIPPLPAADLAPCTLPDEGDLIDDATYASIKAAFAALPIDVQLRLETLTAEAYRAGCPMSLVRLRSRRRFEIVRALVWWGRFGWDEAVICDFVGCLESDLGVALGRLTIDEAARLADTAQALIDGAALTHTDRWTLAPSG